MLRAMSKTGAVWALLTTWTIGCTTASAPSPEDVARTAQAVRVTAGGGEPQAVPDREDCNSDHDDSREKAPATLAAAARQAGKKMGTSVDYVPLTSEPAYSQTLDREFDYVTTGDSLKWGTVQPVDPDHWDFTQGDAIVASAERNHQSIKGHTLVWYDQLPPFVNGGLAPGELREYVRRNIREEVGRYRGRIDAWDVVNEAIADDGSGLRVDVFSSLLGADFIPAAFREAHRADPRANLFYNDYGIETVNPKSDAVYALVKGLLEQGVPVDGVGFQCHFDAATAPATEDIASNLRRFTDLGLSVNISELDVKIASLTSFESEKLATQRQVFHRAVAACQQVRGCRAVTTWGFTDEHTWLAPDTPLEFDTLYRKKPAYYGIFDGLVGIPPDAVGVAPNLIAESSFESGSDGWTALGGDLDIARDFAHTGRQSARVRNLTGAPGLVHDLTNLVVAKHGYDVVAWTRVRHAAAMPGEDFRPLSAPAEGEPVTMGASVTCQGASEVDIPVATEPAHGSEWIELTGSLSVPDCTIQSASIYITAPTAGLDLFVDDVAVRPEPEPRGPDLITNSDFETGTDGWYAWSGTLSDTSAQAHGGTESGVVSDRTATWNGPVYSLLSAVTPGATYAASAWARIDGAATDAVDMTLKITCSGAPDVYQQIASATATNASWVELSGTFTVPACPLVDFEIYLEGPGAGEDLYIDDASVEQLLWHDVTTNAISNSGFESDGAGWSAFGGTFSVSSAFAHSGVQSGVDTGRTAAWNGPSYTMPTWPSQYAVTAWGLQTGTSDIELALSAKLVCNGVTNYLDITTTMAPPSTWVELTGALTVPEGCTTALIYLQQESGSTFPDLYIDDASALWQPLTDVIANSGFESGGAGWAAFGGTFSVSTAFAHSGTQSGLDADRSASWNGPSYELPASPATYAVTAWALQDGTDAIQLVLSGRLDCDGVTSYPYIAGATAAQDTWVVLSGTLTVPSGCSDALLYLNQGTGSTFPDLYIDDVTADSVPE
jgi:GH35 family endo-1,4-beta-xylanase